jgi:hypothetical protein
LPYEKVGQEWVSLLQAQRISGYSRAVLRRLIGNGQLLATKIGRATRIDKHSLESFVENQPEQLRLFD